MQLKILKNLVFFSFLFLISTLAYVQIIQGPDYLQLSQNNRIKLIRLSASRGIIYDRQGKVLAGRRLVFNVAILAQEVKDIHQVINRISPVLGISKEKLLQQFKKNFLAPFAPVVVAQDVSQATAMLLECQESEIPGLVIQTEPRRTYLYRQSLGHILGYLGQITEDELRRFKVYGLRVKDLVGRSGLEKEFDQDLRGQAGGMQIEVNNLGRQVRVLGMKQPQAGGDLHLTFDVKLQEYADKLLEERKGVCIVMNPQNGEILALVSKPSFDPNLFIAAFNGSQQIAAKKVETLLSSSDATLLNRGICGVYAPGSIFKIVTAAAALETNKITAGDRINCPGYLLVGNRKFLCWNLDGHGSENIYTGITHSCNVFFYKLGLMLGPDKLSSFARRFGLGSPTGIDLPYEASGLVPSKSWKLTVKKEKWYDGETANFAIGQGYLIVTPLQIARMVAAVANGGYLVRPHLVKKAAEETLGFGEKIGLKKETLEIIKAGMRQVVQDEQGTGHKAYIAGIQWAAKTGTAQTTLGFPHGWFAGFYPVNEPRYLVLVFLEYGGSGGEAPALIAKEIVGYLIENKIQENCLRQ